MFNFPVVFVDIETTGGSYKNSRVLEVAVIRYENGQIVSEYQTLIDPQTYIPRGITALTGISESDVAGAPVFADIADQLLDIMDGAVFIAHNVRFDYSFLKNEFAMVGSSFSPRLLCTVRLSRYLYADQSGHSLQKLIERHNIPVADRHRALEDARAILNFAHIAYEQHGEQSFDAAVSHQLKTQSLPPHLDISEIESIGNVPGVYIFKDDTHQPIYIGKSITLKKRIMSHFQDTSPKEIKITQHVHHVDTIATGSELGALMLESKLIKEMKPLYNRLLRRVSLYCLVVKHMDDGFATLRMHSGNVDNDTDLTTVYGVFTNRMKAKHNIDTLTRTFGLCPKLMGLEKTKGACFNYSLGKCKGACIGVEPRDLYNRRFEIALQYSKLSEWIFDGPISVPVNEQGEQVIINNWIVQGFVDEYGYPVVSDIDPNFDMDEYKIIKRFINENRHMVRRVDGDWGE
jgi:DNA polymerase III subunit epsilon